MSKIAICAVTGIYHEVDDGPCQDAVGKYENDYCSAVALCDGAGSVENSEIASNLVVSALSKYLCENFEELYSDDDETVVTKVCKYLEELSNLNTIKLDCTLLAVATNNNDKDLIIHVGDGVIIGKRLGEYEIVSYPENGEASNITYFLSNDDLRKHMHILKNKADGYLLTSDGISNLLYDTNEVKKAVSIMFSWIENADEAVVEEKLKSEIERTFKQYTLDDISVAILKK